MNVVSAKGLGHEPTQLHLENDKEATTYNEYNMALRDVLWLIASLRICSLE